MNFLKKERGDSLSFKISLAAARVNAEYTQEQAAELLGVSKQTINAWENGKSEPTYSRLKELANLYKIDIDYIRLPVKSN